MEHAATLTALKARTKQWNGVKARLKSAEAKIKAILSVHATTPSHNPASHQIPSTSMYPTPADIKHVVVIKYSFRNIFIVVDN